MIIPELRGTVGALFGTMADARPHYWWQQPDPDEWSPIQIICHLFESERQVQRPPRLEKILAETNPFLVSPPPPAGPRDAWPCDSDGWQSRAAFPCGTTKNAGVDSGACVRRLAPTAHHSIFGRATLLEMAHFTAQHDRLHINQLSQTLGKCH